MVYAMDLTVLNLAIPQITADLRPTAPQVLWIVDIYGFIVAGALMVMGTLGDRIGRRRLLLLGAAGFAAASIFAACARSTETLILARALLGLAGATLAPSTLSLISNMFHDERERTFAIGMWITSFSAGAIIGPFVGGMVIEWFRWGAAFLIGVPVMLLLLALGPRLLPEYRDPAPRRIDLASALLSLAAVLATIFGIKNAAAHGPGVLAAAALAGGIAIGIAFLARQRRLADPFLDLALFRARAFSAALGINIAGMFFLAGTFTFLAQYFQLVAGLSPLTAGLASLPSAAAFGIAAALAPWLIGRLPRSLLMMASMLLTAAGYVLLLLAQGLAGVIAASVIISVGFTPIITMTTGMILSAAPPERSGNAAAISETGVELGGALGIALLGSLLTLVYRSRMSGADIQAAGTTLAGALEHAGTLPGDAARALAAAARQAFMLGFDATSLLALLALLAGAACAPFLFCPAGPERQAGASQRAADRSGGR